ncbi:ABC transporter permease [Sphingomonas sp. KRR8]|uniref:ABC transporter permease n=1 Tax=Sphingomonas sp. KRR8 TaxID=2942996 RepID=UPI002020F762|nr:ABC transporter permease [Sphingomonas sp. KRR8]URD60713.1 ABC transporter permease [Sphingomonas sp. KRR8]
MSGTRTRLLAMIVKELWAVLRDPRGRIILFVPPLLQLVLFSAAATLEVKNVSLGIYNQDQGVAATEFLQQLGGSPNFRHLVTLNSPDEVRAAIDSQKVIGAVVIDPEFSRDLAGGRPAHIQAIFDGRRSNAAQIVSGYLTQIASSAGAALDASRASPPTAVAVTNWFNPNLDYLWFIMPALVVQIGAISALSVSAQAVARERELGSFEQLMVAPLRTWEILVGKLVPPFAVGMVNATIYLAVIPLVFGVPFTGSIPLFYLTMVCGLYSLVGLGLLISSVTKTQQQAFLGQFAALPPLVLLSGFTSPIDNMPGWLQVIAEANPLTHFNVAMEGLFLKAMPVATLLNSLWPLLLIGSMALGIAVREFRARME